MPKLSQGAGVQIERSNGLVHAATVMQIDLPGKQVQVEWQENDEVKAKQVSLNCIYRLNPEYSQEQFFIGGDGNEENLNEEVVGPAKKIKVPPARLQGLANKKAAANHGPTRAHQGASGEGRPTNKIINAKNTNITNNASNHPPANNDRRPLSPRDENHQNEGSAGSLGARKIVQPGSLKARNLRQVNKQQEDAPDETYDVVKNNNNNPSSSNQPNKFGFGRKSISRPASRSATSSSLNARDSNNNTNNNTNKDASHSRLTNKDHDDQNKKIYENPRRKSGINRAVKKMPSINDEIHQSELLNIPAQTPIKSSSNSNNNLSENPAGPGGQPPSSGRKSVVVGNIAQIQAGREKLRADHAKMRSEKAAQRKKFGHNPNWQYAEFIDEFKTSITCHPLCLEERAPPEGQRITVCVRKRPINKKEDDRGEIDCVTVTKKDRLYVHEPKSKVDLTKYLDNQEFRFDYIFDEESNNDLVYKFTVKPLVRSVSEGGMATCFAYGQTGTGKTHTMGGEFKKGKLQNTEGGLYCHCAKDLFDSLASRGANEEPMYVACSFFEIYSGRVYYLMNNRQHLKVMEDKSNRINVVNLKELVVENLDDVYGILQEGAKCRTSGANAVNNVSSRSHAIFQLKIRRSNVKNIDHKNSLFGQFSLVDLAGNERGSETANDRRVRAEGAEINKSLLALKECIRAMATNAKHIPFRGSQLTQVLRSSFIGKKSKTCMIAMISPCANSCEQTLNTLRYADRVKELPLEGNEKPFGDNDGDDSVEEIVNFQGAQGVQGSQGPSSQKAAGKNVRSQLNQNQKNFQKGHNSKDDSELEIFSKEHIAKLDNNTVERDYDNDERSTIESLSGMDLLNHMQTTRGEKIKMSKEELNANKAAEAVMQVEDHWVGELEKISVGVHSDIVEELFKEFNSPDVDRIVINELTNKKMDQIISLCNGMKAVNKNYRKVLDGEEEASRVLEESLRKRKEKEAKSGTKKGAPGKAPGKRW